MNKLDEQSLKILRQSLPVKGVKRIKEYLNDEFSTRYIHSVLQGVRQRDEIILAAIEIAKEEKMKMDSLKNEIEKLVAE
jgi:hypothetical protein